MPRDQVPPYVRVGRNCDHLVEFLDPKPEQIHLEDIAYGLAKSCRFQGHIDGWYSTAEHCVLGARRMRNPNLRREFLIHDASEYVFSDLSGPIKALLPDYKKMEGNFQRFLNLIFLGYPELDPSVKEVDKRMCATEQHFMRNAPIPDLDGYMPYSGVTFYKWPWYQAYENYLDLLTEAFRGVVRA